VDIIGDMPTTCQSDYLITVTNTTRNDTKSLAGFGPKNIDLGAPGASINSTYPNNTYTSSSGTSQSCPHVSGAVAFMYAAACDNFISLYKQKPDSIALKVKKAILNNGDQLASLYGLSVSGNRLNLYNSALYLLSNEPCKPNVVIKMPNVFTPNNDGINDHFYPLEIKGVNEATLTIINRWGQEVFKSKDLLSGWNGKYKEKDCSDGVYFWILKYTDSYGVERSMKGSVTLT
jgi:gliding motility-associated-like protein